MMEKTLFYDNIKESIKSESLSVMRWNTISDSERIIISIHPSEHFIDYHTHEFFEFNYCIQGSCINIVEGKTIKMKEGDLILMPPGIYHTVFAYADSYVLNISVASNFLPDFCSDLKNLPSDFTKFLEALDQKECYTHLICRGALDLKPIVFDMIDKCLRRFNPKYYKQGDLLSYLCRVYTKNQEFDFYNFMIAEIRLKEIILLMICKNRDNFILPKKQKRNSVIIVNILEYMNKNYKDITLPSLASRFHYSETHLSRLLKEKTGLSFSGLLISVRLSHALVLLCNKSIPIGKISEMIGYDAPSYFFRLFKKEFGMTPLEYRKIYTSNKK